MFGLGENLDYYFCVGDVSMRKGIDALCGVIRHQMGRDPLSGEVYIFMSHDKTRVKLLQWQRGGFVLYYKRLEKGRFELPFFNSKTQTYGLSWHLLFMIIEGISIKKARFRECYTTHNARAAN
jgi:transposase